MDGWVPSNLTRRHIVVGGVEGQAEDVVSVGGVESLVVGGACVDHTQCCNVVDYVPVFGVEEVVATIVTTVTENNKILTKDNHEPADKLLISKSSKRSCTINKSFDLRNRYGTKLFL